MVRPSSHLLPLGFLAVALLTAAGGCGTSEVENVEPQETPAAESPPAATAEDPEVPVPRARGKRAALRPLVVEIAAARLTEERLEVELAFENTSDSAVGLVGQLEPEDFVLMEDAGETLRPVFLTESMQRLDYGGGINPGDRKLGGVAFPRPLGDSFEIRVSGFEPLRFDRRHIFEDDASWELPPDEEEEVDVDAEESAPEGVEPPRRRDLPVAEHDPRLLDPLNRLLDEQAEAIASYDLDRYLATFAADRRDEERDVFLRLRSLPVTEVEMRVDGPVDEAGGHRARVELSYRFDGLPADNPFVLAPAYTFVREGGEWRVAAIEDEGSRPIPWRQGELAVHRSHHFLILTEPRMQRELAAVAADAEGAYAALRQTGLPLASGYAVFFVADADEFRRITGHSAALGAALGRYTLDGDRVTVDSRAFYVNGPLFVRGRGPSLPPEARRTTVTHELVHLALSADTRPQTPPWLKEGVAVYFAGDLSFDANRDLVRRGLDHLDLEQMTRLPLGGHDAMRGQIADEYLFAGNVVAWLVERHGRERLLELYRSYSRDSASLSSAVTALARPAALAGLLADPRGSVAVELTDEALGRHYGLDLAELDAAVKSWLRIPHR